MSHTKTIITVVLMLATFSCKAQGKFYYEVALPLFHHAASNQLGTNSSNLRLYQGAAEIGDTDYWMWNIFNATCSQDSVFYDPAQFKQFSTSYESLLRDVNTTSFVDLQCNFDGAIEKLWASDDRPWNKTIDQLTTSLYEVDQRNTQIDTVITTRSIFGSNEWVIKITLEFDFSIVFFSVPYSELDSSNISLNTYKPWFSPCFFNKVLENEDERWLSQEDWTQYFGEKGDLNSICAAMVVITGGTTSLSIHRERWLKDYDFNKKTIYSNPSLFGVLIYSAKEYSLLINK